MLGSEISVKDFCHILDLPCQSTCKFYVSKPYFLITKYMSNKPDADVSGA